VQKKIKCIQSYTLTKKKEKKTMKRYNTIHKINDTWGSYEEKGKTPQWVNLKTGERYDIKNKETFTEFLERLNEPV
ncbi:TPA: hypothetical protein ACGOU3_002144, partial [Streptococcus suis]